MVGSRLAEAVSRLHAAFVGRDAQMQHLLHRWSEAEAGTLGWVLLAGQPGIGKTRLARELARAVQQRHAAVLWGSCLEADWRPPYGPWLEALRSCAEDADLPRLAEALGPAAALVRPLLPEFGALAPAPPAPAALSPREERIRRYDAAQRLLARLAERQPLLLVLDDVHWADPDSLELLAYLARCLPRRQRMLVIVAYRDTQLDRTNARGFVDLLVALEKDEQTDRITLRGLAKSDVEELLAQVALRSPSARLTHSIWSEAAGHPFYTRELVRHVLDQGQLAIRATAESDASPAEPLAVPEGVQTLLDQRLSRLSAPAAGVLTTACVLAGGFGLPILQALTGLAAAPLSAALGEGLAAGLLRATSTAPAGFDFAHAIVRHALADRLTPDTRAALHRRAAEALEQLPSSHAEHAAEIAAHYAASAALPGSERGIDFALAAAEHARTAFAHERVVACLRLARDLSAAAEPAARANILSQLAIAEASALYLADAPRTAEAAVAAILAHRAEPRRAAELLASIARPLKDAGADTSAWEPLVERGLALVGDQHDLTWARLKLLQDCAEPVAEGLVYARRWLGYDAEAVAIARRLGTEADYANTLETFDWRTPEETAQVLGLARTWRAPSAILRALNVAARDYLFLHGLYERAAASGQELLGAASAYGSLLGQADALTQLASVRMVRGEWLLARQSVQRAEELVAQLGTLHRLRVVVRAMMGEVFGYYLEDISWPALAAEAAQLAATPRPGRGAILGLLLGAVAALASVRSGDPATARRYLDAITPPLERMPPTMHHHNSAVQVAATAVWELDDRQRAPTYRRLARRLVAAGVGDSPSGCTELCEVRMAALLAEATAADWEGVRRHLEATGQRAVRAVADHDEAYAMLRTGRVEPARCRSLLETAEAGFRSLGMTAWATRCAGLRHSAAPNVRPPAGLSLRELDVLRLIALGNTTAEIAAALVLSTGTVERHITHIYTKTAARGRADATAFALKHQLV